MITRSDLEHLESILTHIGLRVDHEWAIGGTIALCVNDPSDVRIPLAHGYSGDLVARSQVELLHALEQDPATAELPEVTAMLNDPLGAGFRLGDTGALGIAYWQNPDAQGHDGMRDAASLMRAADTSALRSMLIGFALQHHRRAVEGLSGQSTVVLTPGGVALCALASSIVTESHLSQMPDALYGPAVMAAEGASDDVAQALSQVFSVITPQLRAGVRRPHTVLATALNDLLAYAEADPLYRDTALPALQAGTAEYLTEYGRAQDFGI